MEEVRRQDRLGLPGKERPPGLPRPPGSRVDAGVLEDLPHRRRRQLVSQPGQLAVDAPVPPARVVPRHLRHQRTDRLRSARPSRTAPRIRPPPLDQVGVPAQQGPRGDDQAYLAEAARGQQPGQRGQDRPVSPGQPRCSSMALENGELVAQDEDLRVLGAVGAGETDPRAKPSAPSQRQKRVPAESRRTEETGRCRERCAGLFQ